MNKFRMKCVYLSNYLNQKHLLQALEQFNSIFCLEIVNVLIE